jgi:endonuclease YncB( thermonuclease family)
LSKLTKAQWKAHNEVCAILTKDKLTEAEREFVIENWHEGATHMNGAAGAFFTPLASVIDGDTIDIYGARIRILDIDAPESRQTCWRISGDFTEEWRCGQEAALAQSNWIAQQPVTCESDKLDKYKRDLARCNVAGDDVAQWLAINGWAVPYRDCYCEVTRAASEGAKLAKRGIWAGTFKMPWEWRKVH